MGKLISKVNILLPIGVAIGLSRIGSGVFGSLNPMLALIFFTGQKQGKINGLIVGIIATLVSSLYCGVGPWMLFQIPLWAFAGYLGGCIKNKSTSIQTICVYGFMFGVIMDICSYYFIFNMGYSSVFAQISAGLLFDVRYCVVSTLSLAGFYAVEYIVKRVSAYTLGKLQYSK